MGIKLFGVDVEAVVADAIPVGSIPEATLTKVSYASRNPADLTAGKVGTPTAYVTRGVLDEVRRAGDSNLLGSGDSMRRDRDAPSILLLAAPLHAAGVVPEANDLITIGGRNWRVIRVQPDPARASYTCQCRPE